MMSPVKVWSATETVTSVLELLTCVVWGQKGPQNQPIHIQGRHLQTVVLTVVSITLATFIPKMYPSDRSPLTGKCFIVALILC